MTALALALVLVAAFVGAVVLGLRALRPTQEPVPLPTPQPAVLVGRRAAIVLDVDHASSSGAAVQRLVHQAAARVLATIPEAEEVQVRARDGGVLGIVPRLVPEPRSISIPEFLHEPHHARHHGPDLSTHLREDEPLVLPRRESPMEVGTSQSGAYPAPDEPSRPIVERFDLPSAVRSKVRDQNDPTDLVRAILEAAGRVVEAKDDLLLVGDLAVAVVSVHGTAHDALNHAYRRIAASGAKRGLVVALGHVGPKEVRRRELLAPQVLHTDSVGLQRMADAVAVGADPLHFAVGPAVASVAYCKAEGPVERDLSTMLVTAAVR